MPANTGKFLPVSVFGVSNTDIPVSVYTGLETLCVILKKVVFTSKVMKISQLMDYMALHGRCPCILKVLYLGVFWIMHHYTVLHFGRRRGTRRANSRAEATRWSRRCLLRAALVGACARLRTAACNLPKMALGVKFVLYTY
jgi:hypothetical protein